MYLDWVRDSCLFLGIRYLGWGSKGGIDLEVES